MRLPPTARVLTVLLAVALVASVTDWVLTLSARRTPSEPVRSLPATDTEIRPQLADTAPIARLFGASDASGNIRALGVMAEGSTGRGIALIGVEGKPARPVHAGEAIAPGVILTEVRRDGVMINRSGAVQQIRLATKPVPPGVLPAK
ncbi:MAG TPA: type II secretion system protein N [Burkholderiales bacterium]|nr:type II secretion system protein N [Burkholderiales bacterium]